MSEVTDAVRALQRGERTIEDVEQMFRTRSWPQPAGTPSNAREALTAEQSDRDPDPEGSFAEVAQAFYDRIITVDQYERLAKAAHDSAAQASPPSTAPSDSEAPPATAGDPPAEVTPEGDAPPADGQGAPPPADDMKGQ